MRRKPSQDDLRDELERHLTQMEPELREWWGENGIREVGSNENDPALDRDDVGGNGERQSRWIEGWHGKRHRGRLLGKTVQGPLGKLEGVVLGMPLKILELFLVKGPAILVKLNQLGPVPLFTGEELRPVADGGWSGTFVTLCRFQDQQDR